MRGQLIEVVIEQEGRMIVLRLFTTNLTSKPEELAALVETPQDSAQTTRILTIGPGLPIIRV